MARCFAELGLLLALCSAGCGGGGLKTYPVKGKIVFDKGDATLLAGSTLHARRETEPVDATGEIREDGNFELATRGPDGRSVLGAPEGSYQAWIRFNTDDASEEAQFKKTKLDPKFLKAGALSFKVPIDSEVTLTVTPARPGTKFKSGCDGSDDDPDDSPP